MKTIEYLVGLGNRFTNSGRGDGLTGIDTARDYLRGRLEALTVTCAMPATFYEQPFDVYYREISSVQSNLILKVDGTASSTNDVIVIGAHYDTMSKYPDTDERFWQQPGANDNGSGVAATLELARLICLMPRQQSYVFVLFAAEEIAIETADGLRYNGRIGSRNFVTSFLRQQGWNVEEMLNLDTIGAAIEIQEEGRLGRASQRAVLVDDFARLYSAEGESRQLARRIQAASFVQQPDFRLSIENREDRQTRWGDHMTFTDWGYPAARLFVGAEDVDRQDTPDDRMNYIEPAYLEKNIRVALAFLLSESEGPPPPQTVVINGRVILWEGIPHARNYLLAQRKPDAQNYTLTLLPPQPTSITLEGNTLFALGTVGANGVMGPLGQEYYVNP